MKRLLALLSAFLVIISLCACSVESVEEHDKKESSLLAEASEEGVQASRDELTSESDSSESEEDSSQVSAQAKESAKPTVTAKNAKNDKSNSNNAVDKTTSVNNKQGSVYSYYVTEYETKYVKKTVTGTKSSSAKKGATTSNAVGKPSSSKVSKSSSKVNPGTSKSATKARITVSQSKIDVSSVLSNPNLSKDVKEKLENLNPYVKDYKMLVPSYSSVTVKEGSTVLDVLELVLETERKGSSDFAANPGATAGVKNSAYGKYVYSICGLAEKDCGSKSGWTYRVNGKMPNVSADKYVLKSGDRIEWIYVTG